MGGVLCAGRPEYEVSKTETLKGDRWLAQNGIADIKASYSVRSSEANARGRDLVTSCTVAEMHIHLESGRKGFPQVPLLQ